MVNVILFIIFLDKVGLVDFGCVRSIVGFVG